MATVRHDSVVLVHEVSGQQDDTEWVRTECGSRLLTSRAIFDPREDEDNDPMLVSCYECLRVLVERWGMEWDQGIADASPILRHRREVEAEAEADREAAGITVEQLPPMRRRAKRRSYLTVHEYESRSVAGVRTICGNYIIGDELVLDPRADDANGEPLPVNCQSCLELLQSRLMRERGVPPAEQVFQDRGYDIHGKKFEQLKSVVHWISPGECSAWKVQRGTCTSATPAVTCRECKALPSYKIRHLEHVERARGITAIHLSLGGGRPACGFISPVNTDTDIALVTCLECLRSVTIPEPEGPPVRRILLDENG